MHRDQTPQLLPNDSQPEGLVVRLDGIGLVVSVGLTVLVDVGCWWFVVGSGDDGECEIWSWLYRNDKYYIVYMRERENKFFFFLR